jgi:hypothetical protein
LGLAEHQHPPHALAGHLLVVVMAPQLAAAGSFRSAGNLQPTHQLVPVVNKTRVTAHFALGVLQTNRSELSYQLDIAPSAVELGLEALMLFAAWLSHFLEYVKPWKPVRMEMVLAGRSSSAQVR